MSSTSQPGLVIPNVTAADENTVCAVISLQQRWATSGITPVRQAPGEAGVRAGVCGHPASWHRGVDAADRFGVALAVVLTVKSAGRSPVPDPQYAGAGAAWARSGPSARTSTRRRP
ncbi:DUF6207 family protein [Streptomyces sp. NPDC057543]|uniref:DUF6207 family protein n=1 Tax=Streptomyces sp. NPDC057543 TaxID=3346163 RepID=UPI0036A1A9C8